MSPAAREECVQRIADALTRNAAIAIMPSPAPGVVWLTHRSAEGGNFDARAVARVLSEGGSLENFFKEKY